MNTNVTFETSKSLKEKGFDLPCSDYYTQRGGLMSDGWGDIIYEHGFGSGEPDRMLKFDYSDFSKSQKETCSLCPTIAEVVMWSFNTHKIWVWVERYSTLFRPYAEEVGSERFGKWEGHKFDSPTEAYLEAINHTLKNLIK